MMVHAMRKGWVWIGLGVAGLLIAGLSLYLDAVLRASIERNINRNLKGYSVRIGAVRFHPIGFSIDLWDTTAVQDAHPDPPVLHIPRLHASIHWEALLHRRLVADFLVQRPKVDLNLAQARAEVRDKTPARERGWQEALAAIYPLKINEFRVEDAEVTYVDQGPFRPLQLSHVNLRAENIRNIMSPEHVYPSEVQLEGTVFDSGRIALVGNANFLAEPHAGVQAAVTLDRVDLDYFKPITSRFNVNLRGGTLSSAGTLEYAPGTKAVNLQEVSIEDVAIEYVHRSSTATAEAQRAQQIRAAAKHVSNDPEILLRLDRLNILQSTFSFRNEAADTPYRLFLSDADIRFTNVSNQRAEGKGAGSVKGAFMGSGAANIQLTFLPVGKRADLDLMVRIERAELPAINELLRSSVGFDVGAGEFSLYSEVNIRDARIQGYIKPLFKDVEVSDPRQDMEKGILQKVKERIISGVAWILRNRPRHEIATRVNLSGTLDSPQYSTWEAIGGLLKNAFLQPLLPGFENGEETKPG
ncbi:MAG TPA: DUF748 domain-containing protein [Candidatus Methylomirabilis sp.]|nr:DUF748 domain-containing protein [Candidatus Methylomirabilis sp.]